MGRRTSKSCWGCNFNRIDIVRGSPLFSLIVDSGAYIIDPAFICIFFESFMEVLELGEGEGVLAKLRSISIES